VVSHEDVLAVATGEQAIVQGLEERRIAINGQSSH
jgi:hypothetical protein